jgi:LysM repeat protein
MAVIAFIVTMALPALGQQYLLYSPQPITPEQKAESHDGILVQEIEVQKGDNLYKLSRKFSGHGMYFPQILLFNAIKNPNLIYAGDTIKIPLTSNGPQKVGKIEAKPAGALPKTKTTADKKAQPAAVSPPVVQQSSESANPDTDLSLSDLKSAGNDKARTGRAKKKSTGHTQKAAIQESKPVTATTSTTASPAFDTTTGQRVFESAVKAYKSDDCRTAIELLDRYLADNSSSPLAADANLYKADCFLKLSAQ